MRANAADVPATQAEWANKGCAGFPFVGQLGVGIRALVSSWKGCATFSSAAASAHGLAWSARDARQRWWPPTPGERWQLISVLGLLARVSPSLGSTNFSVRDGQATGGADADPEGALRLLVQMAVRGAIARAAARTTGN